MTLLQQAKFWNLIPPGVIKDTATFVANVIDKRTFLDQGAKGVLVLVQLGATDIAMTALKVQQADAASDANTLTAPSDLHDFTTKPGAGDDDGLFAVYIPMSGGVWTQRYLSLLATAGNGSAGTYLSALAIADYQGDGAATAAALGLTKLEIAAAS